MAAHYHYMKLAVKKSTCPMSSGWKGQDSISLTLPLPQLNVCDCGTPSKMAGGVGQMSATCQQEPVSGRSLDFHPNFFNCFHEPYPLTFVIYSLAAFAACLLLPVYIWVLSGSINLSECCQLLPIWIPTHDIIRFRCIRKRIWFYFQKSLPNFCRGYQREQITWRSQ